MTSRPFTILGVQQIAVGGQDKASMANLWTHLLGVKKIGDYRAASENVDEAILQLGQSPHAVEIDLMVPLDPDAKPRVDTPPLNHVGLWVDNLESAFQWLGDQGVRFAPGGIRKGASGHNVCFIHPKASEDKPLCGLGVLIELVQAPLDITEALSSKS